jgi:propanol-preferring alcohol dehydrogenase
MKVMVLRTIGKPLVLAEHPDPSPGPGEIMVRVEACGVCRTDLHVVDGDLPNSKLPLVPGHEIVGIVESLGSGVTAPARGTRVGIPWLGHTCGCCTYCGSNQENLCDRPLFTGYTRDGGFATHVVANATFTFPLDGFTDPVATAPLMCAGLIGWRALRMAGYAPRIGIYGKNVTYFRSPI